MPANPGYDWNEVFSYFAALGPTRTYSQVVAHFGMAKRTVERRAIAERWQERVAEIDAKAQSRAEEKIIRDRSERVADTLKIIDAARTRFAGQLGQVGFKLTGAEFTGLVKLESLLEGEATDRIAIAEVQQLLGDVLRVARAVLEEALTDSKLNGKRAAVLAYFDGRVPEAVGELVAGKEQQ